MEHKSSILEHPVLGRGFRPFFLLGAAYSALMLLIWSAHYAGFITPPTFLLDTTSWHAHEMVYGYTMAIIAGFLLTAVANWTGGAPARHLHLLGLCALWITGRIVINIDLGLPVWGVYLIAASFIPALAISLSIPLLKSRNKRNFVFLGLLTILCSAQITFFVQESRAALYVSIMIIMVMISLIGGRVIPAFTVAALRKRGEEAFQIPQMKLDILALISLLATAICLVILPNTIALFIAALTATIIHILRMRHYHSLRTFSDPMLWILHVGFCWLILGLFLLALSGLSLIPVSIALHALTAGAIGSMTLGMMVRVSLGHTGRNLITTHMTFISFIAMQISAILRVFGVLMFPEISSYFIIISTILWTLSFLIYLIIYTPMLVKSRHDGQSV